MLVKKCLQKGPCRSDFLQHPGEPPVQLLLVLVGLDNRNGIRLRACQVKDMVRYVK